jgi:hypothetical protein
MYDNVSVVQLYPPTLLPWYSVTEAEHCVASEISRW